MHILQFLLQFLLTPHVEIVGGAQFTRHNPNADFCRALELKTFSFKLITASPRPPLTLSLTPSNILCMLRSPLAASGSLALRRLLFLAALSFLPLAASAQTVDDILEKYINARGGLAKIKSIQSERISGTMVFSPELQGPFVIERERPLKLHMEVTVGRDTMMRVYDGKSAGWVYSSFGTNPGVQPMSENDLRNILDQADFEGPFINYKAKGNQVELLGKTTVEGKPAYKIKLTNKNGDVSYFSFDAATFLIIRWQGTSKNNDGKDVNSETFFRNYREVDDIQYPFLIESSSPEAGLSQKIIADKIEVNVNISESRFRKPVVPGAEPETPATATPPAAAPPKPK